MSGAEEKYPTLSRFNEIADDWHAIKNFFDYSGVVPARWGSGMLLEPVWDINPYLAEFYDIDLDQLETERRQLVADEVARSGGVE